MQLSQWDLKARKLHLSRFFLPIFLKLTINSFEASSRVEDTLELSPSDTLSLTFTATEGGKPARPHQLFLLIEDMSANLDVAIPVTVKPSGKAKLDLVFQTKYLSKFSGPSRPTSSIIICRFSQIDVGHRVVW
jgi:hypothetical protein